MRSRRGVRAPNIKESVLYVMNKYAQTKKAMTVEEISLLISYSCGGVSVSWRNVQKVVDELISDKVVKPIDLPEVDDEPVVGYRLHSPKAATTPLN